jgi:hypothetical protein
MFLYTRVKFSCLHKRSNAGATPDKYIARSEIEGRGRERERSVKITRSVVDAERTCC